MAKQPDDVPQPPQSPELERRFTLYNYQYIAIPLLFVVPLLAVFGVFGETISQSEATSAALDLSITFPDRMHAGTQHEIEIRVTNRSAEPLSLARVLVDRDYLEQFANVSSTPHASEWTDEYAAIELEDISPGTTQLVVLRVTGHWAGRHHGEVAVAVADDVVVRNPFATLVFP